MYAKLQEYENETQMLFMFKNLFPKSINAYSSVLELRDHSKGRKASLSQKEIRSNIHIAVIDDEKFKPHGNLTNYGYKIQELPDIKSLDQVTDFDVILCDLMGVGQNFDQAIGGASIIREIKENYPTKFVIAYTGARANTMEASAAKEFADDFL
jgi:CheY-like chemotaxis protein